MATQGGSAPAPAVLTSAQIKSAADLSYARIDKANVPDRIFANALINPAFDHWQRSIGPIQTSGSGAVMAADRWSMSNTGTNGYIVGSRTALAFGDNPGSQSKYSLGAGCTGHTSAADGAYISQVVEGVETFAGKRVVLTGKIRQQGAVGAKVALELSQYFGTGGSAQVSVLPAGGVSPVITLTAALQPFSMIFDVPSLSGKVIGTAGDYLGALIWCSAGANWAARAGNIGLQSINVQVTDLELKEIKPGYGDTFPGFERPPKDLDFLRAQRFYQTGFMRIPIGGNTASGAYGPNYAGGSQRLGVPLRILPVLSYSDGAGNMGYVRTGTRSTQFAGGSIAMQDVQTINIDAVLPNTDNINWLYFLYYLSAEY